MYQILPQTGFKFIEQLTQSYAEIMFNTLDYNMKQLDVIQEGVSGVVEKLPVWFVGPSRPAADDEVIALREQVRALTVRVNALENARKTSNWKRAEDSNYLNH